MSDTIESLRAEVERLRAQVEARGRFGDVIVAKANGYLDRLEQQRARAAQWEDLANRMVEALRVSEQRREEAEAEVEASKAAAVAVLEALPKCSHVRGGCCNETATGDYVMDKGGRRLLCDEHANGFIDRVWRNASGEPSGAFPWAPARRRLAALVGG